MRLPRFVAKRTVWIPTVWGWLALWVLLIASSIAAARAVYPFLAPNQPTGRGLLIVEGWLGEEALLKAIEHYRYGDYRKLVTAGGPMIGGWSRLDRFDSYASRSAHFIREHGIANDEVVVINTQSRLRDRTWQSAVSVREWLSQAELEIDALDVLSGGPHSRRTWQTYRRAFGDRLAVGVLSAAPTNYDPRVWWKTSSGTKAVITEWIAWAWATCCFRVGREVSDGGIGITIYSRYPAADRYYRLRHYAGKSFHVAPHPDAGVRCAGVRDSGVIPVWNAWYRFRFQAFDDPVGTRLRAKVWAAQDPEPTGWQVDCVDEERTFEAGRPGLWSMGHGLKLWDELEVRPLDALEGDGIPFNRHEPPIPRSFGYSEDFESYADYQDPLGWFDTGPDNSLGETPSLFKIHFLRHGETSFGTSSNLSNLHSHLTIESSANWDSYEFSGVMAIAEGPEQVRSLRGF